MKIIVKVSDYYKAELFQYIPEDMFDILDEAYFYNRVFAKIPDVIFKEYLSLNPNEKTDYLYNTLN